MRHWIPFLVVAAAGMSGSRAVAEESFEGWHLEPGVAQAHLVMVARVASISNVTIVEGAKTDVALREYRFTPVRRLKGLFQREQLSMTASDLGLPAEDGTSAPPLKEGEYRLLILAQQQGRYMGCVSAAPGATTFAERVPRLTGPDDPLIGVIETLIQVADTRSRRERAALVVARLDSVKGVAAVPLLSSLRLRADWAAAEAKTWPALTRLIRDPAPAVRHASLDVLRGALAGAMTPVAPAHLDAAAEAIHEVLTSKEPLTHVRVMALEALDCLLQKKPDIAWAQDFLVAQLSAAATNAERTAAATALSRVAQSQAAAALLDALAKLPLDEAATREAVYFRAALRRDGPGAEKLLLARLEQSRLARQSFYAEVEALGRIRSKTSLPALLAAAVDPTVAAADRGQIAWALGRLGDDQAAPVLAGWLRGDDYNVKEQALTALETLDTPAAAREARPMLKTEPHLPYKLRIARLLARHQLGDGYSLATEHLADAGHLAQATLVLAALKDARTAKDLTAILSSRPDRRWHAAALSGLAAIGDAPARRQLLVILGDDRHPLAADAAEAAGLAGDVELLVPLAALTKSRNHQIALASLAALRRCLTDVRAAPRGLAALDTDADDPLPALEIPAATRDAIARAVSDLAGDAYVDADLRQEAFAVARLLRGEEYSKLILALADQAELEGTPLMANVQLKPRQPAAKVSTRKR